MASSSISELQQKLYKRMNLDVQEPNRNKRNAGFQSRRDQRKAQRVQKKSNKYSRRPAVTTKPKGQRNELAGRRDKQPAIKDRPKSTGGTKRESLNAESDSDDDAGSEDFDDELGNFDSDSEEEADLGKGEGRGSERREKSPKAPRISKAVQDKLDQDDAEIAEYERLLGIKGRKSLPQAFKDDGLDEILGDLGAGSQGSDSDDQKKRKREYDDWLSAKRRKVGAGDDMLDDSEGEDSSVGDGADLSDGDDGDSLGNENGSDFEGFDSEEPSPPQKRQRENPYVAPSTGAGVAKYIPPSLRSSQGTEEGNKARLRKQVQGLINRLTESNILSIVQSTEELYQGNARGDCTEIITDAMLAQTCKPETLPDQFFVLNGGFCAALYKVVGISFGSHLVRRIVKDFEDLHEKASAPGNSQFKGQKETSNLITFLSQLYIFEVIGCKLIFDYMEKLLKTLSELNVELLLRICRMAGRLLRRDDPLALKHVSSVLSKTLAQTGSENISVRTKFMVDTINDLGKGKSKAKGMDSAVVSEHVQKMKKRLGELKSRSRRLDGLTPMGMSLNDIREADTRGEWWLVGASVPPKEAADANDSENGDEANGGHGGGAYDDEDMDFILPDYSQNARAQGLTTMAQISIFTALMSASNYEHGYRQFSNLRLKKDEQLQLARVLVQCVGSEDPYNEYYALVGRQACSRGKLKFALQDRLWGIFRGLGESLFGEEPEDDDTADGVRMKDEQRVRNVARFYASLIADGALTLAALKPLDLPQLKSWARMLVEQLLISVLERCRKKGAEEGAAAVDKIFRAGQESPTMGAGLQWFLRKKVRKSKLLGSKEAKKLSALRERAEMVVQDRLQE